MKRSLGKTSFLFATFFIVMANVTDYMYLVLQIKGIIGIYGDFGNITVAIVMIIVIILGHLMLRLSLQTRQKLRYYASLSMVIFMLAMIVAECMYAEFRI